ncbi:MAG: chorismate-binding protein, partial [Planctomycetales bacterium]|nr:chorismate-binding protein [Planctomycetales bacterium]
MPHLPSRVRFDELASDANYDYVPVYRRLISDAVTPVVAFTRLDQGQAAGLFESVIGGEKVGRWSFIASDPFQLIEARGSDVQIRRRDASGEWICERLDSPNPLETLRQLVAAVRVAHLPELPPFIGGAVGYAGYDTVRYVENLPHAPEDDRQLPDLAFGLFDHMVVFDNVAKTIHVLTLVDVRDAATAEANYQAACQRVDRLVNQLAGQGTAAATSPSADAATSPSADAATSPSDAAAACRLEPADIDPALDAACDYASNFTREDFENSVRKCVEYIEAGDIFQVVISQRLQTPFAEPPFELYRTLRVVNPSPFMFYLRLPEATLVGSSPEIMVRVVDGCVTVRPLAGTRRRGATEQEDAKLAEQLLADPKERAEHVMLVDLGR